MITVERKVHFQSGRHTRKELREGEAKPSVTPVGRVPRVARLMALAIRLNKLIRDGVAADQAELARLGHVTRARLTQISTHTKPVTKAWSTGNRPSQWL